MISKSSAISPLKDFTKSVYINIEMQNMFNSNETFM